MTERLVHIVEEELVQDQVLLESETKEILNHFYLVGEKIVTQNGILVEKNGKNTARFAKGKMLTLLRKLKTGSEKNIANMDEKQRTELILKQLAILGSLSGLVVGATSRGSSLMSKVLTIFS